MQVGNVLCEGFEDMNCVYLCFKLTFKAKNRIYSLHHWYQLCRFQNQVRFYVDAELCNYSTDNIVMMLPANNNRELWNDAELYILAKPSELNYERHMHYSEGK